MSSHKKYPRKSPQTASRVIDGEAVIIVPQDNEVKVLNEVGSRIWELLDGRRDISQLTDAIAAEFDVSYTETLEDITRFIEELEGKHMIICRDHEPCHNCHCADSVAHGAE
jgi:hypothetical protein